VEPAHAPYDFIIAGGGLAGLSLACHMVRTSLRERSILIVDRDPKEENDRTWGFWANKPTLFDGAISRTWSRLLVASDDGSEQVLSLGDYRYHVIRGADFYEAARSQLAACDHVTFLKGSVSAIEDGRDAAGVIVDGRQLRASWVFDSLPARLPIAEGAYQVLRMHFRGWEVATAEPAFDPETMTFMDFRTPQAGEMRFFYVLPYASDRALVEYTIFSQKTLPRAQYEAALRAYLDEVLKVGHYTVVDEERGAVPITDDPLIRVLGRRVMAIGARAGRVKPSTGYAFMRVQKDCQEIIDSLLLHGHPFDVPDDPDLHDVLDAVLLRVMAQDGGHLQGAFGEMFRRNPIELILRFLDESSSPWENFMLVASMPPALFLKAFVGVATQQNLFDIMKG
jgi:lycopene beta-cyclase